jgi:hypothetical protein
MPVNKRAHRFHYRCSLESWPSQATLAGVSIRIECADLPFE